MKTQNAFVRAVTLQHRLTLIILTLTFTLAAAPFSGFGAFSAEAANTTAEPAKSLDNAAESLSQEQKKATGESRFAKFDGARIHYMNYGKGDEALVLIHGWTMNVDNWRDQIQDLAKGRRLIVVDLPGHGQSDKPQVSYSMDYFARAVEAVMRDAKVKRAVLVGHSMGTPVARQFYRKYPEKTLAIVVADGALGPFADKATMDQMINGFRGPNYRAAINQMFGMMKGGLSSETVEHLLATSGKTPQHVLVSAMEGMADTAIWGTDKINVPVLAIMARNPMFPPNMEEIYRAVAPNLDFRMWEDVGHFVMMEKPKGFNEAVLVFLEKHKLLQK